MIELQILNKILEDKSLTLIIENNITKDYFQVYKHEFEFIYNHYKQYNNIPDKTTFIDKFEDFDIVQVIESDRYLVEQLKENYLFSKLVPFIKETANLAEEDSRTALNYVKRQIDELSQITVDFKEGTDLIQNAELRLKEFEKRREMDGLLGISTGIKELDKITFGFLEEDFWTIIGRTNEGKTWILLFFLVQAWIQKKKVLLYNGELPNSIMGFRFDTIYRHFSNYALTAGDKSINIDTYKEYIEELKNHDNPFIIIKPKDVNGRLTSSKLEMLIQKYEPDIIGIDQITLMDDERRTRGQGDYKTYEHISQDLYLLAEKYGVPILAPHQAGRSAIKSTKNEEENVPELTDIYASDAIAQNSKRVLTFKKVDKMLKLCLKKNTYGKNNQEICMMWDIDAGIMKPFLTVDNEDGEQKTEMVEQEGVELF